MISIIIPLFNQEKYIEETLDSVFNQTINVLDVIVVNDGSTDSSDKIASRYPVKLINQVNKGLASARNTGIMNAKFDWILPLDADDILLPNALDRLMDEIETDADIIAPSFREFGLGNRDVILGQPTLEDFKIGNRIGYLAAIKKSALLEIGGYNPKMVWGAEDYDLWFDLLKRGKKLVTIPEVLWLYRLKEQSMWTETQKHKDEFMNQIKLNHYELFR